MGTSTSMEADRAVVLWKRSVKRLNMRYVNVVSDGDSKAIKAVKEAEPYGDDVEIECVGHVQKRVGAAIIKLIKKPPIGPVEVVVKKAIKARKATKKDLLLELDVR